MTSRLGARPLALEWRLPKLSPLVNCRKRDGTSIRSHAQSVGTKWLFPKEATIMTCRILSLFFAVLCMVAAAPACAAEKPNVLFLLSDDQQYDAVHALGNDAIQTPNLDKLVQRGCTFTRTYCAGALVGAVCQPSRSMIMTGRSLFRSPIEIPANLPTMPETLDKAGYTTFATGKWHNSPPVFARLFRQDADNLFFGGMTDQTKVPLQKFDPTGKYDKKDEHIGDGFSSTLFADAARKFLKGHKGDKPFFLYVAFTAPHDPRTPPKEFADKYDPKKIPLPKSLMPQHPFNNGDLTGRDEMLAPWPRTPEIVKQHIADYYGMITHMDAEIGRILKTLEDTGHDKDTIIVYTSDHGLALGRHGLFGKQNLYEHSMRPPLIFAGPGVPQGKKSDALVYLYDLFPTICDLTSTPIPDTVEGKSLVPILKGKEDKVRDTIFLAYKDIQRAVRTDRWKLIRYTQINKSQLFDLKDDPDELKDLAGDPKYADKLKEMTALLVEQQKKFGDMQPLSPDKPAPLTIDLSKPEK
jgi:arylsulfatase A-like enzyme